MVRQLSTHTPASERALSVLELLARSKGSQHLSEIARTLSRPKSSVHRVLLTLVRNGYLWRDEKTRRYRLGVRFIDLARMTLARSELCPLARTGLFRLMRDTGLTVHMGIPAQNQAVLIAKIDPPGPPLPGTWVGRGMDFHCTGIGKALLANLPEDERRRVLKIGCLRYNENTIVCTGKLWQQLSEVRRLGYAVDDEEEVVGLRCIGVPVFDRAGKIIAAISVAGTTEQIHSGNMGGIAARVAKSASEISGEFGLLGQSD